MQKYLSNEEIIEEERLRENLKLKEFILKNIKEKKQFQIYQKEEKKKKSEILKKRKSEY